MSSFEHCFKGVKIKIVLGDITELEVDAIVNPANSSMYMGGGVAGAIKRAGGVEIETEALRKSPVEVGLAIATRAGRLPSKFVIHAPTMTKPATGINKENIKLAMRGVFKCATSLGISSLAFPGLGTGVGGISITTAAKIMMKELEVHLSKITKLKEVIFVGYNTKATEEFEKTFLATFEIVG